MHKIYLFVVSAVLATACSSKREGPFELKGQFQNSSGETIYLEKLSNQPVVVDSTTVDDEGNFEFTSYQPKIGFYRIKLTDQNFAVLVLDSADKVNVKGNLKDLGNSYKVEGSSETALFLKYSEMSKRREGRLDSLKRLVESAMASVGEDRAKQEEISNNASIPYNEIIESSNREVAAMIMKNSEMYSSLIAVQALEPDKYIDVFKKLDEGLNRKFPRDQNVKAFHDVVNKQMATLPGQTAPEIVLPSPDGQEIALSSFRGKVVLIDFWASWCKPCRVEMPNVVKAYAKFRDKGFEILGVSLDQDKGRWIEAIKADGITWPQVSDLKYWQSSVVGMYSIQGIPYTVLVDREGKIIAKGLRGEELDRKLDEVLSGSSSDIRQ